MPLRTRLTFANTIVVAVALLAFTAVAYVAVRATLASELDARLQTTGVAAVTVPDVRGGRIVLDPDDREQFRALLSENHVNGFVTARGTIPFANVAKPPEPLLARVRRDDGTPRGDVRSGDDTIAYAVFPVRKNGIRYGDVVIWSTRSFSDAVARTTLFALLAASLVVIAIAAMAGGWLAGRMLRPVTELSSLISHIEASDLSERLEWDGPDDELGRLCLTFDRLLDRVETAFVQQRRFTADASHELRTPISVMRAEIELALARDRHASDYREALERLQAETSRLEALIESLLLTARGESTPTATQVLSLAEIARRVVDRMATPARNANVRIAAGTDDALTLGDLPLLESAVLTLADNAIRHASPGGDVRIDVRAEGAFAHVTVTDSGPGFSERALRDATQRFWRDDASRSGSGTGLGLSIADAIAQRHHGSLVLRNAENGGAVAAMVLPRQL